MTDLSSSNGTRYLDAKIVTAHIPLGASVELGRTTLRLAPIERHAVERVELEVEGLVGRSLPMQRLYAQLARAAPTQATVLIHGESGAGKEAVARALHGLSLRRQQPFHTFDCGAVNRELIESALFGHAQGAFTGAVRARAGLFEAATGSTLMLDEVGAMPLELQAKLLRVLESREFTRVGEHLVRRADVRIIATTQRDLDQAVREGSFRADLYFRLAVIVLEVPPLRERAEDVPLLAAHFARAFAGFEVPLAPSTLASLRCSSWPGNVRELRNAVERVVALGALATQPGGGPEEQKAPESFNSARARVLEEFERDYVSALLARHKQNVSAAAREAGLARSAMYRLLERHRLVQNPRKSLEDE